ncbi:ABC transporter permease/M1 family aminopeptidase [Chondrinema litorale]|uniref:ABC transporter permease/M1 family aminopeptidase n=1 Tax=Chondrinema litorale TaxID=2994555 RepID=UPI002542DA70|nr:M1 family aminopeptidase [Chondrinema litorale]UZR98317.1 M1 family aminopeptidase [Chondrinema litorale]
MIKQLLPFEIYYYTRQKIFWLAAIVFLLLGTFITAYGNFGGKMVHVNAPVVMAIRSGLITLILLFVAILFSANGLLRDREQKMELLVFASPISKSHYFISRFAGIFISVLLVFLLAEVGFHLGLFIRDASQVGTYNLYHKLWNLLAMVFPNLFFITSFLFLVALLFRNVMAIYAAGLLIFIAYFGGSILGNSPISAHYSPTSPENEFVSIMLDPFGLSAVFLKSRGMSPEEQNHQFLTLSNAFLANRIFWLIFSIVLLGITYFKFEPKLKEERQRKSPKPKVQEDYKKHQYKPVKVITSSIKAYCQSMASLVKMELNIFAKDKLFWAMAVLYLFIQVLNLKESIYSGIYNTASYPTNSILLELLMENPLLYIFIIFYAAEVVHRAKACQFDGILNATPFSESLRTIAKVLVLTLVISFLLLLNNLTGICFQVFGGYYQIAFLAYTALFIYYLLPFIFWIVVMVQVQSLLANKYVGMAISALLVGFFLNSQRFGLEHPLLQVGVFPKLSYSEMSGFGHYLKAYYQYLIYWFAFLFGLIQLKQFRNVKWFNSEKKLVDVNFLKLTLSLIVWILVGAYIFYQVNFVHQYHSAKSKAELLANYELAYKPLSNLAQPVITSVKVEIDVYPEDQFYKIKGNYFLKNKTETTIDTLWFSTHHEVNQTKMEVSETSSSSFDRVLHQYFFTLERPLLPNQEIQIDFDLEINRNGFARFDSENAVLENGSYIELDKFLPQLGYNESWEIADEIERKNIGLPPKEKQLASRFQDIRYEWIDYEAVISVPDGNQEVISIAELENTWEENGRKYFNYKSSSEMPFMLGFAIADYEKYTEDYLGKAIEVFYQKGQEFNVERLVEATKHSLDSLSSYFTPYPYNHLRIVEIPDYRGAATSYPGVIFISEDFFLKDVSSINTQQPDYIYASMLHEISHQWWGGMVEPADFAYKTLTETLAQHNELMLMEEKYGRVVLRGFLKNELESYLTGRAYANEPESSLMRPSLQSYLVYNKGTIVMNGIQQLVGKNKMIAALKKYAEKYSYPNLKSTTNDLLNELIKDISTKDAALISEWMSEIVLYDFRIDSVNVKQISVNDFEVTVFTNSQKWHQTQSGKQAENFNEKIEIGFFNQHPDFATSEDVVSLQEVDFHEGEQTLIFHFESLPEYVVIDPFFTRVETSIKNNLIKIPEKM